MNAYRTKKPLKYQIRVLARQERRAMSEEQTPYYLPVAPKPEPADMPQTWHCLNFHDGSQLEILTRGYQKEALAVQWAEWLQALLKEKVPEEALADYRVTRTRHG